MSLINQSSVASGHPFHGFMNENVKQRIRVGGNCQHMMVRGLHQQMAGRDSSMSESNKSIRVTERAAQFYEDSIDTKRTLDDKLLEIKERNNRDESSIESKVPYLITRTDNSICDNTN